MPKKSRVKAPVRPDGPLSRRERIALYRDEMRAITRKRDRGICQGCADRWTETTLEWHHTFGRQNLIEEPYASMPEVTAMICHLCHRAIHDGSEHGVAVNHRLRLVAVGRLADALGFRIVAPEDPVASVLTLVREARAAGIEPEAWRKLLIPRSASA